MEKTVKERTCSAGFLIETDEGFLMCHPTGQKDAFATYDVPKGMVEDGEDHFEAALRELYEETSIDWRDESFNFVDEISNENDVKDLGQHKYIPGKDLHLFYVNRNVDVNKLKCLSFFERNGRKLPEVNFYKVSYELDYFYKNLQEYLKKYFV